MMMDVSHRLTMPQAAGKNDIESLDFTQAATCGYTLLSQLVNSLYMQSIHCSVNWQQFIVKTMDSGYSF